MNLHEVPAFNEWQKLVVTLRKELYRRGYDLRGATDERIIRIAESLPATRLMLNRLGYEWIFPPEEQHRLSENVRFNVAFMNEKVYAFGQTIEVITTACVHGKHIYCHECWAEMIQRRA